MAGSSRKYAKEHGEELRKFLAKAQIHGYGEAEPAKTEDGGSVIEFQDGIWRSKDIYYGGEPFSGMLTVFREEKPCFSMVYWGRVFPNADQKEVLACLAEALQHPRRDYPWRGPAKFRAKNGLRYHNASTGSVRKFSGDEKIWPDDSNLEMLYEAHYFGGLIDLY